MEMVIVISELQMGSKCVAQVQGTQTVLSMPDSQDKRVSTDESECYAFVISSKTDSDFAIININININILFIDVFCSHSHHAVLRVSYITPTPCAHGHSG